MQAADRLVTMRPMVSDSQPVFEPPHSSLAVIPAPGNLPVTAKERPNAFRFWRRRQKPEPAATNLEDLSISTLHTELQTIDEEISQSLQNVAALEAGEREALARRDKVALDVAWLGRETETAKIKELDDRRSHVYDALKRRVEPELESWRARCEAAVAGWHAEDRQQIDRIESSLREIETLVWSLTNRDGRRANQRQGFLEELEALQASAAPIPVTTPEIDWTTQAISLRDITVRLQSVMELLQRPGLEPRSAAE